MWGSLAGLRVPQSLPEEGEVRGIWEHGELWEMILFQAEESWKRFRPEAVTRPP